MTIDDPSGQRESLVAAEETTVFVVHGRDERVRDAMFTFLHSIGLRPLEWSHAIALTGSGAPYVGDVLQAAFSAAKAIVVVLTPDDVASLRPELQVPHDPDYEIKPTGQARPNVLFEAGMAFGRSPNHTIFVEIGNLRPFSDIAGRHVVRFDGSVPRRQELAIRLASAGCTVDLMGTQWHRAGDFGSLESADPSRLAPTVDDLAGEVESITFSDVQSDAPLTVALIGIAAGRYRMMLANTGPDPLHDLTLAVPNDDPFYLFHEALPLESLGSGQTASYAIVALGPRDTARELTVTIRGRDEGGDLLEETFSLALPEVVEVGPEP